MKGCRAATTSAARTAKSETRAACAAGSVTPSACAQPVAVSEPEQQRTSHATRRRQRTCLRDGHRRGLRSLAHVIVARAWRAQVRPHALQLVSAAPATTTRGARPPKRAFGLA